MSSPPLSLSLKLAWNRFLDTGIALTEMSGHSSCLSGESGRGNVRRLGAFSGLSVFLIIGIFLLGVILQLYTPLYIPHC